MLKAINPQSQDVCSLITGKAGLSPHSVAQSRVRYRLLIPCPIHHHVLLALPPEDGTIQIHYFPPKISLHLLLLACFCASSDVHLLNFFDRSLWHLNSYHFWFPSFWKNFFGLLSLRLRLPLHYAQRNILHTVALSLKHLGWISLFTNSFLVWGRGN